MKPITHTDSRSAAGMTLIEVTVVIAVLLGLVSVLFLGVSAYEKGTNRAMCIQNIYRVQTAMRVACNYNELEPGRSYDGLKDIVIGESLYITDEPVCPSNGTYEYLEGVIPPTGVTFLTCNVERHVPTSTVGL